MDSNNFEATTNGFYKDKELVCEDCGKSYILTVREQEFYAEIDFQNEPKRCKECRDARRSSRESRGPYIVICARCGNETKTIYPPSQDRPFYCPDCYRMMKEEY